MIKIIRPGREVDKANHEAVCQICGCIFQFDYPADTITIDGGTNRSKTFVECPCCRYRMHVFWDWIFKQEK